MLVVVDYGMGNLRSVAKALERAGAAPRVSAEPADVARATTLVVPGVGAGPQAMRELQARRLVDPILQHVQQGKPYFGICLGLQLLFDTTEEQEGSETLHVLRGTVRRFQPANASLKVPHIGWNCVQYATTPICPLFDGIPNGSYFYFVHSYYADPTEAGIVASTTDYDSAFASAVWRERMFATQFHPEKSQELGLRVLRNFVQQCH
jgi:imidazole glycerol-phosphate synthase subunit HisH